MSSPSLPLPQPTTGEGCSKQDTEESAGPSETEITLRSRMKICSDLLREVQMPGGDVRQLLDSSWANLVEAMTRDLGPTEDGRQQEQDEVNAPEESDPQRQGAKSTLVKISDNLEVFDKILLLFRDAKHLIKNAPPGDIPQELSTTVADFDKAFEILRQLQVELIGIVRPVCEFLGVDLNSLADKKKKASQGAAGSSSSSSSGPNSILASVPLIQNVGSVTFDMIPQEITLGSSTSDSSVEDGIGDYVEGVAEEMEGLLQMDEDGSDPEDLVEDGADPEDVEDGADPEDLEDGEDDEDEEGGGDDVES